MKHHHPNLPPSTRRPVRWPCSLFCFAALWATTAPAAPGDALNLARNGATDYRIVIPAASSRGERAAADELAGFLREISGATFPIVTDDVEIGEAEILLADNAHLEKLGINLDFERLGPEGYHLLTAGRHLVIAGGPRRGTINGVYGFLQDVIGCRWYHPRVSVIPRKPTLAVPALDSVEIPAYEARNIFCRAAADLDWAARMRLNYFTRDVGHARDGSWEELMSDPRFDGFLHYAEWHVHTFIRFVHPDKYFAEHPEFFSEIDGQRVGDEHRTQLCMTNPELVSVMAREACDRLAAEPTASIIAISGGDYGNYCRCATCTAAYERHGGVEQGGVTAVYMSFVSQAAVEIEKKFPHVLVETLAYDWYIRPSAGIRLPENMVIRFAPYGACIVHDLDGCGVNRDAAYSNRDLATTTTGDGYTKWLKEWAEISPRVWGWYYSIPKSPFLPFPNLPAFTRDLRVMHDCGVTGMFIQANEGAIVSDSGDLVELKWYLMAQLMWNPHQDVETVIRDFCNGYYGPAGPDMLRYVSASQRPENFVNNEPENDFHRGLQQKYPGFHTLTSSHAPMNPDKLEELDAILLAAVAKTGDQQPYLDRVRSSRLALDAAIIRYGRKGDPLRMKAAERLPSEAALVDKFHVNGGDGVGILNVDQLLKRYMQ